MPPAPLDPSAEPRLRPLLLSASLNVGPALLLVTGLAAAIGETLRLPSGYAGQCLAVFAGLLLALTPFLPRHLPLVNFGAANRVTLLRAGIVALLAGFVGRAELDPDRGWLLASLAGLGLLLDGIDGWLARRHGLASPFGARFDMELDAFLILVLCLCLMTIGKVGAWVVAIGALRYVFVLAMRVLPWLARPLPDSLRRKLICVWQVASLLASLSSWIQPELAHMLLGVALLLLIVSFGIDIVWLRRRRFAAASASNPFAESAAQGARMPSGLAVPGPDPGQQGSWGGSGQAQQGARS